MVWIWTEVGCDELGRTYRSSSYSRSPRSKASALEDLVRPIWPEPGILAEKDGAMT
ncbi:hypothetical protein M6B38_209085 [Iris pallida]|uniref:Uncharacterized protein n=1 Tax=Iris pallida TaxID=29817 RepID=A0AAX6E564_IRIPA|nr:hypothetical protein M6B38_209085 [Iris pallida]